jgi:hypothetical protein
LAAALAHEARLNRPSADGKGTVRDHLLRAARSRTPWARAKATRDLAGPEFPESMEYLEDLVRQLHGRSGISTHGIVPATWASIDAMARRLNVDLRPHEVQALFRLDGVMLNPPAEEH